MEVLRTIVPSMAAVIVAVGAGLGMLGGDYRGAVYGMAVLVLGLLPVLEKRRVSYAVAGLGVLPAAFVTYHDVYVLKRYGELGWALLTLVTILGTFVGGSWLHERFLLQNTSGEWIPLRPGAVAGMKLQNQMNRVISERLRKEMAYEQSRKEEFESKLEMFNSEFETTQTFMKNLNGLREKCSAEEFESIHRICSRYSELLDISTEDISEKLQSNAKEIHRLDRELQGHAPSDFNLMWR